MDADVRLGGALVPLVVRANLIPATRLPWILKTPSRLTVHKKTSRCHEYRVYVDR